MPQPLHRRALAQLHAALLPLASDKAALSRVLQARWCSGIHSKPTVDPSAGGASRRQSSAHNVNESIETAPYHSANFGASTSHIKNPAPLPTTAPLVPPVAALASTSTNASASNTKSSSSSFSTFPHPVTELPNSVPPRAHTAPTDACSGTQTHHPRATRTTAQPPSEEPLPQQPQQPPSLLSSAAGADGAKHTTPNVNNMNINADANVPHRLTPPFPSPPGPPPVPSTSTQNTTLEAAAVVVVAAPTQLPTISGTQNTTPTPTPSPSVPPARQSNEAAVLEQIRSCWDASSLLALLQQLMTPAAAPPRSKSTSGTSDDVVRTSDTKTPVAAAGPTTLSDSVATEALLRLSALPRPPASVFNRRRTATPAVSGGADGDASPVQGHGKEPAAADAADTADITTLGTAPAASGPAAVPAVPLSDPEGVVKALFRQLQPSYGRLDPPSLVALLEAAGRLKWLLGRCTRLSAPPPTTTTQVEGGRQSGDRGSIGVSGGTAATAIGGRRSSPTDERSMLPMTSALPIGGRPNVSVATETTPSGDGAAAAAATDPVATATEAATDLRADTRDRLHPAVPLIWALLPRAGVGGNSVSTASARLQQLLDASPPLAAAPEAVLATERSATPPPSLAARMLAALGRLRMQDPVLLGKLLPALTDPRRRRRPDFSVSSAVGGETVPSPDLAAVVIAAAQLQSAAQSYGIRWANVCAGLAAPGALAALPATQLVRLVAAVQELGWNPGSQHAIAVEQDQGLLKYQGSSKDHDLRAQNRGEHDSAGLDVGVGVESEHRRGGRAMVSDLVSEAGGEAAGSGGHISSAVGREEGRGGGPATRLWVALCGEVAGRAAADVFSVRQLLQLLPTAATAGLREPSVLQALADASRRQLPHMRPDEISQILCGLAKLGCPHPPLLHAVGAHIAASDPMSYNVRSLAITVWAVGCFGLPCPELFTTATAKALLRGIVPETGPTASPTPTANRPPGSAAANDGHATSAVKINNGSGSDGGTASTANGAVDPHASAAAVGGPLASAPHTVWLQPYAVANAVWAFARQGVRQDELLRRALEASLKWDEAGDLPRHCLIKTLWAASVLGYGPAARGATAAGRGMVEGGGGGDAAEGSVGEEKAGWKGPKGTKGREPGRKEEDVDRRAARRVMKIVFKDASQFSSAEIVQAAEALLPYCAPGAVFHKSYGKKVHTALVEATLQAENLRLDAFISLLSALFRLTPPPNFYDTHLLARANQRLARPLATGQLSPAQLLQLLDTLTTANACGAAVLPALESEILARLPGSAAADGTAATGRYAAVAYHKEGQRLSASQAVEALVALGALQRHDAVLPGFRQCAVQLAADTPSLERLSPETLARLLRTLGAACVRHHKMTSLEVTAQAAAAADGLGGGRPAVAAAVRGDQGVRRRDGMTARSQPPPPVTAAAVAEAALGPVRTTFLEAMWRALAADPERLGQLTTKHLVDLTWGLAACGYDKAEAYDQLADRLLPRVRFLPGWSLARLATAMHGNILPTATATPPHGNNSSKRKPRTTTHPASPPAKSYAATAESAATTSTDGAADGGGGGGSHLRRHPELAERIAKYGTPEMARPSSGLKPEAVVALTEVYGEIAPEYGGLFLAAAHRARQWLAEAEEAEIRQRAEERRAAEAVTQGSGGGGGGSRGGWSGDGVGVEARGTARELRAAAARVRTACVAAGYDVSEVLGEEQEWEEEREERRRGGSGKRQETRGGDGLGRGGGGFGRRRGDMGRETGWGPRERVQRQGEGFNRGGEGFKRGGEGFSRGGAGFKRGGEGFGKRDGRERDFDGSGRNERGSGRSW